MSSYGNNGGAIELAIASAAAIISYLLLLGALQYRRFRREAVATGTTLKGFPAMLDGAPSTLNSTRCFSAATSVAACLELSIMNAIPDARTSNHRTLVATDDDEERSRQIRIS
jgi:putative peptidoglycan lipid II flippase